jgi:putative methionine-R-sulfoxide reductase with GAF domain
MLLSPIKLQDKVIGIISADKHGINGFDEHDRMLILKVS